MMESFSVFFIEIFFLFYFIHYEHKRLSNFVKANENSRNIENASSIQPFDVVQINVFVGYLWWIAMS